MKIISPPRFNTTNGRMLKYAEDIFLCNFKNLINYILINHFNVGVEILINENLIALKPSIVDELIIKAFHNL